MRLQFVPRFVAGFLPLFLSAALSFGQGAPVRVREDIRTFSKDASKVAKLRKAVDALRSKPKDQAASWINLANIHGYPGNLPPDVPPVITELYAQCHRKEDMFFLWHRSYVWSLEKLMQEAITDPDFRLPYWDWYSDPALPPIFRDEWLDPQRTKRNPLYVADRKASANAGRPVWNPVLVSNFRENRFGHFQDGLNFGEHGTIHIGIGTGTNMGNKATAARDPIFWVYHANIDRLLTVWKKMGAQHTANTTYPDWHAPTYRFPAPGWTMTNPTTVTPSIVDLALNSSSEMMGYRYEKTDPPGVRRPSLPLEPAIVRTSSAGLAEDAPASEGATLLAREGGIEVGAAATVKLRLDASARARLLESMRPGARAEEASEITVILTDVRLATDQENVLSYRVFVNLPSSRKTSARFLDHFVGSISLFALARADGDERMAGMAKSEFRYDATQVLAAANSRDKETALDEISVSIVPVLAPDAKTPEVTVLTIGQVRLETSIPAK